MIYLASENLTEHIFHCFVDAGKIYIIKESKINSKKTHYIVTNIDYVKRIPTFHQEEFEYILPEKLLFKSFHNKMIEFIFELDTLKEQFILDKLL
jgi:hypothetical protein